MDYHNAFREVMPVLSQGWRATRRYAARSATRVLSSGPYQQSRLGTKRFLAEPSVAAQSWLRSGHELLTGTVRRAQLFFERAVVNEKFLLADSWNSVEAILVRGSRKVD